MKQKNSNLFVRLIFLRNSFNYVKPLTKNFQIFPPISLLFPLLPSPPSDALGQQFSTMNIKSSDPNSNPNQINQGNGAQGSQ